MRLARALFLAMSLLVVSASVISDAGRPILLGLDAEFGHRTSTSAEAIRRGMEIAIAEINAAGGLLGGRPLELVVRDNRSITARGVDNLRELAALPDLVAVFGGKFSPVYVECLPVAHELGVPLMDPWGAADIITDHEYRPSYSFRLSLKDSWAAPVMLRFAMKSYGAKRVGVLLPNTAWGRSNRHAIERASGQLDLLLVAERWYNWGETSLLSAYRELQLQGAEAILMVANEAEGSLLVKEVAALPESARLPIVSHWGITGGDFVGMTGPALSQVRLAVVQTYSFIGRTDPIARRVVAALQARYGVSAPAAIESPAGVAHAYDLTHLLALAVERAGTTERARVRDALEHLGPYQGLVKHYPRPFTPERHDALSPEDVFMAHYTEDGRLIPAAD